MNINRLAHNPIPDSFFSPKDRLACKRALELKEEKTTILCIAGNLKESRQRGNDPQFYPIWRYGVVILNFYY